MLDTSIRYDLAAETMYSWWPNFGSDVFLFKCLAFACIEQKCAV